MELYESVLQGLLEISASLYKYEVSRTIPTDLREVRSTLNRLQLSSERSAALARVAQLRNSFSHNVPGFIPSPRNPIPAWSDILAAAKTLVGWLGEVSDTADPLFWAQYVVDVSQLAVVNQLQPPTRLYRSAYEAPTVPGHSGKRALPYVVQSSSKVPSSPFVRLTPVSESSRKQSITAIATLSEFRSTETEAELPRGSRVLIVDGVHSNRLGKFRKWHGTTAYVRLDRGTNKGMSAKRTVAVLRNKGI